MPKMMSAARRKMRARFERKRRFSIRIIMLPTLSLFLVACSKRPDMRSSDWETLSWTRSRAPIAPRFVSPRSFMVVFMPSMFLRSFSSLICEFSRWVPILPRMAVPCSWDFASFSKLARTGGSDWTRPLTWDASSFWRSRWLLMLRTRLMSSV